MERLSDSAHSVFGGQFPVGKTYQAARTTADGRSDRRADQSAEIAAKIHGLADAGHYGCVCAFLQHGVYALYVLVQPDHDAVQPDVQPCDQADRQERTRPTPCHHDQKIMRR